MAIFGPNFCDTFLDGGPDQRRGSGNWVEIFEKSRIKKVLFFDPFRCVCPKQVRKKPIFFRKKWCKKRGFWGVQDDWRFGHVLNKSYCAHFFVFSVDQTFSSKNAFFWVIPGRPAKDSKKTCFFALFCKFCTFFHFFHFFSIEKCSNPVQDGFGRKMHFFCTFFTFFRVFSTLPI